jgi:hypothetical protein
LGESKDYDDIASGTPHASDMKEIESVCAVLERVAKLFPAGSDESEAISEAASAYLWLGLHENLKAAYNKWRSVPGEQHLSERQKARIARQLRGMGIDTDGPEQGA